MGMINDQRLEARRASVEDEERLCRLCGKAFLFPRGTRQETCPECQVRAG